ncbi:spondin-1-like [Cimex lectularius]|uniref:Spondin domain-containing protein n=1 Tax=Cimex lectularius TaxID=79782 RepID=A0A8I6RDZ3_CIMLE|nr:spondin-1-like [Cimex lectularius]
MSHGSSWKLFRVGTTASPEVKNFAETGKWELADGQGTQGVLDHFTAPPVTTGQGRTETQFFLDGNHSKVSIMSRIIPSPDWFVGLDSFQLCVDGNWLDTITLEVDPLDAGTDNGFTFTAPNWVTQPQGVVYRITSRFPAHPAGSFYYPYIKRLPPIATFQFIKVKEYEISEVFHHGEDEKRYEVVKSDQHNAINIMQGNEAIQLEMEEERKEEELVMQQKMTTKINNLMPPIPTRKPYIILPTGTGKLEDDGVFLNTIVSSFNNHDTTRTVKSKYKKTKMRDCKVGDWGEWSGCSSSCGVGEMSRERAILRPPRRGGVSCPPLRQVRWCASPIANCTTNW